jgi:hypothetical protein
VWGCNESGARNLSEPGRDRQCTAGNNQPVFTCRPQSRRPVPNPWTAVAGPVRVPAPSRRCPRRARPAWRYRPARKRRTSREHERKHKRRVHRCHSPAVTSGTTT